MSPIVLLAAILSVPPSDPLISRCLIPDVSPGRAKVEVREKTSYVLSNDIFAVTWTIGAEGESAPAIDCGFIENTFSETVQAMGFPFEASTSDGRHVWPFGMKLVGQPKVEKVKGDPLATQIAARCDGQRVSATFLDQKQKTQVLWSATLLDYSNYVRQEVTFKPTEGELPITKLTLVKAAVPGATVRGSAPGSPAASDLYFFGLEHPMSESKADGDTISCSIGRKLPIAAGGSATYSSVFGVAPKGQLRRGFLNYLERERARPYAPFLHYNSWYDIGYFTPYSEADCLDSINAFGRELVEKRRVKMDSFLFDDGWDDPDTVWQFNKGFPNGFLPLKEAAQQFGAAPGMWLSPWGGYGKPRGRRLAAGQKDGYEIDSQGYALSGSKYYAKFRQVCLDMVGKYGINQFKLDGTGSPDKQVPGSQFGSDFEAAIQLIKDLRAARPGLFINLTTGTWPSPFWLRYADSTWRGGDDHSFAGVGTKRQQWMTYRDGDTFAGVVRKGPLYPVTSLMLHGIIYAKHADGLDSDPGNDFAGEAHDYFGGGTQLQEMYISHGLLNDRNWDDLAEAANWSRANADVLLDSHWIGGDPLKLDVYGWASWSPRKGIVVLRNPSDKPQTFSLDVRPALELPDRFRGHFDAKSPWLVDSQSKPFRLDPGKPLALNLAPFQVLVLDLRKR